MLPSSSGLLVHRCYSAQGRPRHWSVGKHAHEAATSLVAPGLLPRHVVCTLHLFLTCQVKTTIVPETVRNAHPPHPDPDPVEIMIIVVRHHIHSTSRHVHYWWQRIRRTVPYCNRFGRRTGVSHCVSTTAMCSWWWLGVRSVCPTTTATTASCTPPSPTTINPPSRRPWVPPAGCSRRPAPPHQPTHTAHPKDMPLVDIPPCT